MPESKRAPSAPKRRVKQGAAVKDDFELETKTEPSQDRAKTTFENILTITGELLVEVGFERLSTNLICKRAGITPPALYRYFPNKYAILHALGDRLMKAQDDIVLDWIKNGGLAASTFDEIVARNRDMIGKVIGVTKEFPGGAWVLRVMHVIPILRDVRRESGDMVAQEVFFALRETYPHIEESRLRTATMLTTETMYTATEIAIEQPEREKAILDEVCFLVASYFERLRRTD